jgi:hypothetical protein
MGRRAGQTLDVLSRPHNDIGGERLQITVRGTAREVSPAEDPGLMAFLIGVYGREAWDSWMSALPWARIDADRMITFCNQAAKER